MQLLCMELTCGRVWGLWWVWVSSSFLSSSSSCCTSGGRELKSSEWMSRPVTWSVTWWVWSVWTEGEVGEELGSGLLQKMVYIQSARVVNILLRCIWLCRNYDSFYWYWSHFVRVLLSGSGGSWYMSGVSLVVTGGVGPPLSPYIRSKILLWRNLDTCWSMAFTERWLARTRLRERSAWGGENNKF